MIGNLYEFVWNLKFPFFVCFCSSKSRVHVSSLHRAHRAAPSAVQVPLQERDARYAWKLDGSWHWEDQEDLPNRRIAELQLPNGKGYDSVLTVPGAERDQTYPQSPLASSHLKAQRRRVGGSTRQRSFDR